MPQELRDALLRLGGPRPAAAGSDDLREKLLSLGGDSSKPSASTEESDPGSLAKESPALAHTATTIWSTRPGAATARRRIVDAAYGQRGRTPEEGRIVGEFADVPRILTDQPPSLETITEAAQTDPKVRELLSAYWRRKRELDRDYPRAYEAALAQRKAASLRPGIDPVTMGRLSEEKLGEGRPGIQGPLPEARRPGEPIVDPIEIVRGEQGVADTPEKLAAGDAIRALGGKPMTDQDVASAVLEHLSAIEGGQESKWTRENPWKARTITGTVGAAKAYALGFGGAKLLGAGLSTLAPGLAAAPAAVKALGTIAGAEGILQGQRIAAGGQEKFDWESAAVNAIATTLGAGAGMAAAGRRLARAGPFPTEAARAAADRLAAIWTEAAQNTGQIALAGARAKREGQKFGPKEFGLELYQALLETGVAAAMPELSPAVTPRFRGNEGPLERDLTPAEVARIEGPEAAASELQKLVVEQEAAAKARREAGEAQINPATKAAEKVPDPIEEDRVKAAEAAVDILEEQVRQRRELDRPREERRARRAERAQQEVVSESLGQAKKAIESDMAEASSGGRLMMSHKDYADRIAQQFGLDEEGAKAVHQHATETFLRLASEDSDNAIRQAQKRSDQERAWREYRDETERANEAMQRRVAQAEKRGFKPKREVRGEAINPLDVIARWNAAHKARLAETEWAFHDSMRGVLGKWRKAFEKATGYGFDPRIRDSLERHGATMHEMLADLQRFERDRMDFLRSTPNAATVDRAMTMAAELGPEQGASVVTRTMPPDTAKRFLEIVDSYRKIQRKAEDLAVELRVLPTHRYMVPGIDANGRATTRDIPPVFKGDQVEIPKEAILVGGTTYFREQGGYVHHGYGRALADEARRAGKDLEVDLFAKLGKKFFPNWSKRRTKSADEWYEQGNVSLAPTIHVMRDLMYRNYVAGIQADLAKRDDLVRSEKELSDEDRYQIQQARLEKDTRTAQIKQITKQMREEGVPIWADEDGTLLRRMMPRKTRAMARLSDIAVEMVGKGIPFEGFPDGFDPAAPKNRKRAAEITAAQARYRERLKTANLYHQVERPDTLFGKSTRSKDPRVEEMNARLRELYMLREIAEGRAIEKYTQVHGSHWGALNGKYVRADALRAIKLEMDSGSYEVFRVWDALQKLAKVSLVAHNPLAGGTTQILSNMTGMMLAGVNPISGLQEHITAWSQMARYVLKQERAEDPLLNELITEGLLQSAGLLFDMPDVTRRKLLEGFGRAEKLRAEGRKAEAITEFTIASADLMRWMPSQIPLFGRAVGAFRMVDLAPMYGMYRQLRTGIGSERAPMSKERAFAFVRDYYDMGDVPQIMRQAFLRRIWDFGRWPVKSGTALAKWAMLSPLSIGIPGTPAQVTLPRPFGKALREPGTPAHRRALIANVVASMALNATKVVGMYMGIQKSAEMALGIEDDEKYQARKMAEARGSWVRSLFLVPVQKTNGDITFYDTWNLSPWGAAMNLFNVGVMDPKEQNAVTGILDSLVNKSVLIRTGVQLASGRDWLGNEIGPGEAAWTATRWALPSGITSPAELAIARARGKTSLTPAQIALRATLGQRLVTSVPGEEYRYLLEQEREKSGTRRITIPVNDTPKAKRLKRLMDNSTYGIRRRGERN